MIKDTLIPLILKEDAQSTVEYVIIAAIMAIFGLGAVKLFGQALGSSFKRSAQWRAGPLGITYGAK